MPVYLCVYIYIYFHKYHKSTVSNRKRNLFKLGITPQFGNEICWGVELVTKNRRQFGPMIYIA